MMCVTMGWMETSWIGLEDLPHWFNLLAYGNWDADLNLNDELIRNIMELPNSSFLSSTEDHAKLRKTDCSALHCRKELQVLQTVWQYDSFLHSTPIQHQNEQADPDCRFKLCYLVLKLKNIFWGHNYRYIVWKYMIVVDYVLRSYNSSFSSCFR